MKLPRNLRLRPLALLSILFLCVGAWASVQDSGAPATNPGGSSSPGAAFLGPFHMVMLHFPIGLFGLAALLEAVAWFRPFDGLRRSQGVTLGLGVLTSILASVLGLYRSVGGDYSTEILIRHRNTGIALTAVAALTWMLHTWVLRQGQRGLGWYRGSLGATLVLLLVASHHGGSLTHGQGFLTQNAPAFLRGWLSAWDPPASRTPTQRQSGDPGVAVARLFEAKCLSCHGPEKQKGKFRIDQRESLLRGGATGVAAVVPGDPGKSGLLRLIQLPSSHDEVMPPLGKEPLGDAEILAVFRWIQAGAP